MLSTLDIKLLGGFCLSCADKPIVGVTAERPQALLAYLVLHRDIPQTRQRLAFQFWADSTEAQARTNLRRELHHLRQGLPEADRYLLADAKTLQWNPHAPFVLDVAEFERAFAAAEAAERAADVNGARTAWEQAIALYGGDLLPSCEDEWIFPEREHLRQKLLHALESLTRLSEAQGDYRAAIRSAQRLLEIDPLHETSYAALMRSHHLNGDRANALQVYHRCMTLLREELGVDPSASTRKLYEQLLLEDAAPDIQPSSQSAGPPQTALFPSPLALSPLVGRDREWASIQQWANPILLGKCGAIAHAEASPVLLLAGEPGIGKTRLLEELRSTAQAVQVLWGRGFAAEMVRPYGIWIDALRSLAMPSTGNIPPELGFLLPELGQPAPASPDMPLAPLRERSHLFDAVVQLLAECADRTPVLVILDDIQWIDEASSALLHYAQQTIIRPSASIGAEMGYDFAHDIVRQAVYRQLSQPRRHLIHLQIAHKLNQLSTPDGAWAGDIARHAAMGGDRQLAASSALSAAERCLKVFAYAEASELAQLGIEQCQGLDDRTRIQLHLKLLRVSAIAGVTGDRVSQLDSELHRLID
ncbi:MULTISPECIES: BTAD domain-containing putative transcriptional regulator [unclassified Microcoleus]|uniref:BTAD domain-containing putative transcriptional regulator n=1 Tax=unclassified Microcoleus TaxID=2642155 RepID=UPI002FD1E5AA